MYNDQGTHDGFDDVEDMSANYENIASGNNIIPFPPTLVRVNGWALQPFTSDMMPVHWGLWLALTLLVAFVWGKHIHSFLGDL
jgi:hypothetical protein